MHGIIGVVPASEARTILGDFSAFFGGTLTDEELVVQIDDWWFVPRVTQGLLLRDRRGPPILLRFGEDGSLPSYFQRAHAFMRRGGPHAAVQSDPGIIERPWLAA